MISLRSTQKIRLRAFGWVQDPSSLRSLCDVVAVFDPDSAVHARLVQERIPALVEARDGRDAFLQALNARPLKLSYDQLVGSSFKPRRLSRCNGIVQAAVKGQGREFIGDWPADNYVRWAHCFGFIQYDYDNDTFSLTESGWALTWAAGAGEELTDGEAELLTEAALAYPPAIRVLELLAASEDAHLTKFEIGQQLGFIGEAGFTSMPQKTFVRSLAEMDDVERSRMKADWEGSSDKYARMIAGWLAKLGLVKRVPKQVTVAFAGRTYTDTISHAYTITAAGLTALRRAQGMSRHKRIPKNVCWEMLATKGADREYLRTRRALILKCLADKPGVHSADKIQKYLEEQDIRETAETIRDDIKGLQNIGLTILEEAGGYRFADKIRDFVIPRPQSGAMAKSDLSVVKERLRARMTHLPHTYLALLDLAYDSTQNRMFEIETVNLLVEECGYQGVHLGGSRKPDGAAYTVGESENYGIILDTKAYSKGYNLPISQADEMERYIGENQTRDPKVNPNEWRKTFPAELEDFCFLFVAGHFTGNYKAQLDRISRNKGIPGAAVSVQELLLCAEDYKAGKIDHGGIRAQRFTAPQI